MKNTAKRTDGISTPTIFSQDVKIQGEIFSQGLIEIEGYVKGSIKGNLIVIREDGVVEGEVIAESLSIKGKFNGEIKAKILNISSKANVTGNIEYSSLSVEDGACIDGQFKRTAQEQIATNDNKGNNKVRVAA